VRAANRELLRARAFVAWLDAPTATLAARLRAHEEPRPLLASDDPAARLGALRAARAGFYAEVADLRVATEGRTVEQICEMILSALSCS
jgi:shikimate kinase